MTKKKNSRQKHQRDASFGDTSDEELNNANTQGKKCPHIARGVQFGRVKKSLKSCNNILTCSVCSNDDNEELPEVWLCLQCGYRGCGRMSENKHALQHFKTIHSDCHSIVLSTTSGSVWCYDCDEEVNVLTSNVLKQCVDFIMKMTQNTTHATVTNVNKVSAQKSLQNDVIKEEPVLPNPECEHVQKVQKNTTTKEIPQKTTIKGLKNLGNTCFFNAVMQNLTQTHLLLHELTTTRDSSYSLEVPQFDIINEEAIENETEKIRISTGQQFSLSSKLLNFFENMNSKSTGKSNVVDPHSLFSEISVKCPQFRHYQQQDSHELLRQLLDNVRQDEIRRQKLAILKHFGHVKGSVGNLSEEAKKKIKACRYYASHTLIERIFGGLLISIVTCEECEKSSQVLEPFMDLSLPLFEEKQQEHDQLYAMLDGGKQDHMKPLRNRKNEYESDENTNEYILTKPKNDGKPSKYQEKKQRQLSKKERGRAAKEKKRSQNRLWDAADAGDQLSKTYDNEDNNEDGVEGSTLEQENSVVTENSTEKHAVENGELNSVACEPDFQFNMGPGGGGDHFCEARDTSADVDEHSFVNIEELPPEMKDSLKEEKNSESEKLSNLDSYEIIEEYPDVEKVGDANGDIEIIHHDESSDSIQVLTRDSSGSFVSECNEVDHEPNEEIDAIPPVPFVFAEPEHKTLETASISAQIKCKPIPLDFPSWSGATNETQSISNESLNQNCDKPIPLDFPSWSETTNETQNISNASLNQNCMEAIPLDFPSWSGTTNETQNISSGSLNQNCVQQLTHNFYNCLNISKSIENHDVNDSEKETIITNCEQENSINSSSSIECDSLHTHCTSSKSSVEDECSNDSNDNLYASVSTVQNKEWISELTKTLKPRYQASSLECSIYSCLSHFTKPELLTGNNKFRCENCTELKIEKTGNNKEVVYTNANKQMLIFSPPAILTLQLKRFQQTGMSLRKINRFVEFPLLLDLAPFCSSICLALPQMSTVENEILYSLYGIVEHSGRLTSGHYTAYVKASKRTVNTAFECNFPLSGYDLEQLLHKFSDIKNSAAAANSGADTEENIQWFYISDTHVKEASEAQVSKCQAYLLFYERIK